MENEKTVLVGYLSELGVTRMSVTETVINESDMKAYCLACLNKIDAASAIELQDYGKPIYNNEETDFSIHCCKCQRVILEKNV